MSEFWNLPDDPWFPLDGAGKSTSMGQSTFSRSLRRSYPLPFGELSLKNMFFCHPVPSVWQSQEKNSGAEAEKKKADV